MVFLDRYTKVAVQNIILITAEISMPKPRVRLLKTETTGVSGISHTRV